VQRVGPCRLPGPCQDHAYRVQSSQIVTTLGAEPDIKVIAIARSSQWLLPTCASDSSKSFRPLNQSFLSFSPKRGPDSTLVYTQWQKSLFSFIRLISSRTSVRHMTSNRVQNNDVWFRLSPGREEDHSRLGRLRTRSHLSQICSHSHSGYLDVSQSWLWEPYGRRCADR